MKHSARGCFATLLLTTAGLAVGCGASVSSAAGSSTTSAGMDSTGAALATTAESDSSSSSGSSGAGVGSTGTTSTSSGLDPADGTGCPGFFCQRDGGSFYGECNMWSQDCAQGEKCTPYADDGGQAWNAWRCVPVDPDPDPIGAPCTVEGLATGIDSCKLGAMCWRVDPDTGIGTCTPHCIGSEWTPLCADPARVCSIGGSGVIQLCLLQCDPLLQDCADGEGCYPIDNTFVCAPDISEPDRGLFQPCESPNACAPGLVCLNPDVVGGCGPASEFSGCCTLACAVNEDACPDTTSCVPWFQPGQTPPGYEDVGVCVSPTE